MANYRKSFNFRSGVQVDDDNFIVNPNGLVGIGTSIPTALFDLRGTAKVVGLVTASNLAITGVSTFYDNVTIGSGIVLNPSSGAVGATTFYGSAAGLTGFYAVATDGWYVDSANSGIFTSFKVGIGTTVPEYSLQIGTDFSVDESTGNVNTSGIITATSFSGDGSQLTTLNASNISSGTLNNSRLPSSISVTSVTATTFTGSLSGTANLASNLTGNPTVSVTSLTASNQVSAGIITSGITSSYTRSYTNQLGVGTHNPMSNIHVVQTGISSIQVTSGSAEAIISLGRSMTYLQGNGVLRFGNTSGLTPYSNSASLDIINYNTGNINNYLQLGSSGTTGSFNWFHGTSATNLMRLTASGKLGLGSTQPTETLHVGGSSTVTSNSYVGNNLYVANDLYIKGNLSIDSTIQADLSGTVTGELDGNVYATSGISTFNQIVADQIGVSDPASTYLLEVGSGSNKVVIGAGEIGIGTVTITSGIGVDASNVDVLARGIAVGTKTPSSYADFSNAGKGLVGGSGRFLIVPKLTNAEISSLVPVSGAIIFNTTSSKFQGYTGVGWTDFH